MVNVINMGGGGANVQSKTVKSSQTQQTINPPEGVDGFNPVIVSPFTLQSKTANPSTAQQVIKPDTGVDALSQVTVEAAKLQSKSISPSTSSKPVTPDSGYLGLSRVTVNPVRLQEKTVTPSNQQQIITPDTNQGYLGLSKVTVNAVQGYKTIFTQVNSQRVSSINISNTVGITSVLGVSICIESDLNLIEDETWALILLCSNESYACSFFYDDSGSNHANTIVVPNTGYITFPSPVVTPTQITIQMPTLYVNTSHGSDYLGQVYLSSLAPYNITIWGT